MTIYSSLTQALCNILKANLKLIRKKSLHKYQCKVSKY